MSRTGIVNAIQWFGLAIGLFALTFQLYLQVSQMMAAGRSIGGGLIYYFAFFTVLTNSLVVICHAAHLGLLKGPFEQFTHPRLFTGILIAILLVSIVFHLLLAHLITLTGLSVVTDFIFHTLAPILFLVWWILQPNHGTLSKIDPFLWALWPVFYLAFVLIRAPIAEEVPYPFLEYWTLGWQQVLTTCAYILISFIIGGYLLLLTDKTLSRR